MKLFRPTFCCCCGEKIDRIEWRLWTSRRFCEVCESVYKGDELLPRIVMAAALLFGLFGVGTLLNGGSNASAVELSEKSSVSGEHSRRTIAAIAPEGANAKQEANSVLVNAELEKTPDSGSDLPAKPVIDLPDPQSERTFYCGARTKKGTPCSRRVKEEGRCWQHRGMPAMKKGDESLEEF